MKKNLVLIFLAMVLTVTAGVCESRDDAVCYYDYAWGWLYNGLRGDEDVCESSAFNYAMVQCAVDEGKDPFQTTGYTFMDLDGDGRLEMIIGQTENRWETPFLFEIWTHGPSGPVSVLQGWDRNRLYLTYDGKGANYGLYQEGAESAFESIRRKGRLRGGRVTWENVSAYNAQSLSLYLPALIPFSEGLCY